ncbi:hypothetical protein HDV57DRAFT_491471 [Trichoderma longibrachiatum]
MLLLLAYALIGNSASCWPMAETGSSETQQLKIPSNWTRETGKTPRSGRLMKLLAMEQQHAPAPLQPYCPTWRTPRGQFWLRRSSQAHPSRSMSPSLANEKTAVQAEDAEHT